MKTFFYIVGASVFSLWLLSTLGVGHLVFVYGPDKLICTKEAK